MTKEKMREYLEEMHTPTLITYANLFEVNDIKINQLDVLSNQETKFLRETLIAKILEVSIFKDNQLQEPFFFANLIHYANLKKCLDFYKDRDIHPFDKNFLQDMISVIIPEATYAGKYINKKDKNKKIIIKYEGDLEDLIDKTYNMKCILKNGDKVTDLTPIFEEKEILEKYNYLLEYNKIKMYPFKLVQYNENKIER